MTKLLHCVRVAALLVPITLGATACGEAPPAPASDAKDAESAPAADRAAHIRSSTQRVNAERIGNADAEPQNWLAHGRTYDEQRFSPLTSINRKTVARLSLAWWWDTGTTRGLEATPIVVDGTLFTTGTWSVVYAHDAATGELIWQHDPKVPRAWGYKACCDVVNRGVAVWEGTVFVGTLDGRLQALDAATGALRWETLTIDPERPYTITGAPRVIKGRVIIGNGGAELGVRGYVTAYDARSGEQLWRFYTVPGDPSEPFEHPELEMAAKTWRGGEWWKVGGGGTAWDAMAYDPALDHLYVGVGNGSPWSRYSRSPGGGDNLFLASILALDPDDGRLIWHYQTTPGDNWDYTAVQPMILADLTINGRERKVLMQAPKNGFFYVLDRTNGALISAEAYTPITWASHVDLETGRPVEHPDAHYANEPKEVRPGPAGGHNWHPMSFSPETGLVYVPVTENRLFYAQEEGFAYNPDTWNTAIEFKHNTDVDDGFEVITKLVAWDPVQQTARWRVDHGRLGASGVLATAGGLVFQPGSDCSFSAYDAETGKRVWTTDMQMGAIAAPVSFEANGEQYILFVAGWGGAAGLYDTVPCRDGRRAASGRILAYKLDGDARLPPAPADAPLPPPLPQFADAATVAQGETLFNRHCGFCHGMGPGPSGVIPNLAYSTEDTHKIWDAIVLGGAYASRGMVSFAHLLNAEDTQAIRAYVIHRAHKNQAYRDRLAGSVKPEG